MRLLPKKGDMVYIPSNVYLMQASGKHGVSKAMMTDAPINVIVTDLPVSGAPYYKIFHEGETWTVSGKDIFAKRK